MSIMQPEQAGSSIGAERFAFWLRSSKPSEGAQEYDTNPILMAAWMGSDPVGGGWGLDGVRSGRRLAQHSRGSRFGSSGSATMAPLLAVANTLGRQTQYDDRKEMHRHSVRQWIADDAGRPRRVPCRIGSDYRTPRNAGTVHQILRRNLSAESCAAAGQTRRYRAVPFLFPLFDRSMGDESRREAIAPVRRLGLDFGQQAARQRARRAEFLFP
jgi:hypothetical protein